MRLVAILPSCVLLAVACTDATGGATGAGPADPAAFEAARDRAFRLLDDGAEDAVALAALVEAHRLDPSAVGVNLRLGDLHARLDQGVDALRHYQAALAARPGDQGLLVTVVGLELQLGRDGEALDLLPRLAADPALAGEALHLEARILDLRGERDQALERLRRAEALPAEQSWRAVSLLGRLLFQDGEFAEARACFSRALVVRPDHKEALKGLADASRRLGRTDEAARWDEVLALLLALTDDEYVRKRVELRREKLTRLVEIHPAWTGGFTQLAELLRKTGDRAGACTVIESLLARHGAVLGADEAGRLRATHCGSAPR